MELNFLRQFRITWIYINKIFRFFTIDRIVFANVTNSLSMMTLMTLSVSFYSTTHVKQIFLSQLQYAKKFMKSKKEALKRCHSSSGYYFTNMNYSWYPLQKVVLITRNYTCLAKKKLDLFILLYQIKRNYELGPTAILEKFFNEQ